MKTIPHVYLLRPRAEAAPSAVVAVGAVHAVRRLLAVDAASVEVVAVRIPAAAVIVVETGVVARIVLPLILVALFPVSTVCL